MALISIYNLVGSGLDSIAGSIYHSVTSSIKRSFICNVGLFLIDNGSMTWSIRAVNREIQKQCMSLIVP